MKALGSTLVAILLAATGGTAHAQIYKWVDEAGKTHYSDQAPARGKPDTIADRISVYTHAPALLARAAAPASTAGRAGRPRIRPGPFHRRTGTTAGNFVGPGITPGTFNGPNAITAGNFTFR